VIIDEKCRWFSMERDKASDLFRVMRKKKGLSWIEDWTITYGLLW